jgi:hypothetical protein
MEKVVMISEVNPVVEVDRGHLNTISAQAREWYGITLKNDNFRDAALELDELCKASGRILIIRDWSFINFTPFKMWQTPPHDFLILDALHGVPNLKIFGFIRDAIDVWISRGMPDLDSFADSYLAYARKLSELEVPLFKYEDFCKSPDSVLQKICACSGVDFDSEYITKYARYYSVKGDIAVISRGQKGRVRTLGRRAIPMGKVREIYACREMHEVNMLFDYPPEYFSMGRLNYLFRYFHDLQMSLIKKYGKKLRYLLNRESCV